MILTDKERQIINALIEEELNCTINCNDASDGVIASYSNSLATILMKLNEKSFRMPENKCFYFVSRELTSRQLV